MLAARHRGAQLAHQGVLKMVVHILAGHTDASSYQAGPPNACTRASRGRKFFDHLGPPTVITRSQLWMTLPGAVQEVT